MRRTPNGFIALISSLLLYGCQATCQDACRKIIVECEAGIPSYNVTQCAADCSLVQTEYDAHDYLEPQQESFSAQLECIQSASCDEILTPDASGSCYQQFKQLYVF